MTSRQLLIDSATRHQVFLNRFAGSTYNDLIKFVNQARRETNALLINAPENMTKRRYERLVKELRKVNRAIYKDLTGQARNTMIELAEYEAGFTQRLLDQAIDTPFETVIPATKQLQAAAFTTIMDAVPGVDKRVGLTVGDALRQFGVRKAGEITSIARTGFALGKTNQQITNDINNFTKNTVARQADTLTRTITNHVAAQARNSFYEENDQYLGNYRVVATLDSRTSHTCQSLDGKEYSPEEFNRPPYHWNCRSTYIRIPLPEFEKDLPEFGRPSKGDSKEVVSSRTTYAGWIRDQSKGFQDEVLGPARGKLLRAGMPVDGFVDGNFQTLNLDQLRTKDNQHIFDKAGL